jgi:hypothetical protein
MLYSVVAMHAVLAIELNFFIKWILYFDSLRVLSCEIWSSHSDVAEGSRLLYHDDLKNLLTARKQYMMTLRTIKCLLAAEATCY